MTAENNVCYYGHRIGCPYANGPNCRRCAERLTHAVNHTALNTNSRSAEVAAYVGNRSYTGALRAAIAASILGLACLAATWFLYIFVFST
jgi:hypothetical protein